MNIYNIIILISALAGFAVALYIGVTKMRNKPLICPIGSDCTEVVTSSFSKFMGMHLEFMGVGYYTFVIISNVFFLYSPGSLTPLISQIMMVISAGAFIFSIYLASIQIFKLKHWCTWCLFSGLFSTIIFIAMLLK